MIKNSVIVTALFDIGRDKWSNYNQSYNTYLFWMDNVLNVDSDFIIYTEEKFLNRILESRKKIDKNLTRTKIILKNFEDLDSYKKHHDFRLGQRIFTCFNNFNFWFEFFSINPDIFLRKRIIIRNQFFNEFFIDPIN